MSEDVADNARALAELRDRIDTIDAEMHRLLIERGSVIDELVEVKGTGHGGAAYRPMREASMTREMLLRHRGRMPFPTVEHIWREIITAFTHLQAPFQVTADLSVEPDRMRDAVRFAFGFAVDVSPVDGADAVVARVAASGGKGVVARASPVAWWRGTTGPTSPKVMAVLPYVRIEGRPADLPAFVIAPPLADPSQPDLDIYALESDELPTADDQAAILAVKRGPRGYDLLMADAGGRGVDALGRDWRASALMPSGGIAWPIDAAGDRVPLGALADPGAR